MLRGLWASQSYEKVLQSHSQHCLQPCCYFLCIDWTEVLLFLGGLRVYFIPSFLLNLLPASLPSSSENSEGNSGRVYHFPRIFPLLSAAHLCFTPVPLWIPPRNENCLHCMYLQVSFHTWTPIKLSDMMGRDQALQSNNFLLRKKSHLIFLCQGIYLAFLSTNQQTGPEHTLPYKLQQQFA